MNVLPAPCVYLILNLKTPSVLDLTLNIANVLPCSSPAASHLPSLSCPHSACFGGIYEKSPRLIAAESVALRAAVRQPAVHNASGPPLLLARRRSGNAR